MMRRTARAARAMLAGLWLGAGLLAMACGKTVDHRLGEAQGGDPGASNAAGTSGKGGSAVVGGGNGSAGEQGSAAGDGGQPDALACVDGAFCQCGNDAGTLHCDGSAARCSCPAAEVCETKLATCFEPCGGEPYGSWVLEQTCLPGSTTSPGCSGGFLSGAGTLGDLHLRFLENEPTLVVGSQAMDLEARVPLSCLGIDSVKRCSDAALYAAPLLYQTSSLLACEATECGDCKCSGHVSASAGPGLSGQDDAWRPGSETLSLGATEVPYCVNGDTLWIGGELRDGTPKVSYKFRRRSCVGAPVPCEQRQAPDCGYDGSCNAGRCLATGNEECDGLRFDACSARAGCTWSDPDKCFGSTAERCEFTNCNATPGCSWGEPHASCGGEPKRCYTYAPGACPTALGCELSNCLSGESPDEPANCYGILSSSDCAKAVGCTQSGYTCEGATHCWDQTDAQACRSLGCLMVDSPQCDGNVSVKCSELSVDDCTTVPGCRIEW